MSKASAARRLAATAAYGGTGLGLLGGSLYGVLAAQATLARRRIGNAKVAPPDPSGRYGAGFPGVPVRLAVLGDSGAAGYGATVAAETFGAFLATGLADLARRPVALECYASVGAQTTDLEIQISRALAADPEVCAVIVGTNDVTHRVHPSTSVRALRSAVERLQSMGTQVVVGTCPDLGTIRPVGHPLRLVARTWSRRLAAAQAIAVVEGGGRAVSLATILGPEFEAAPRDMFGPDQFHPSTAGYQSCAAAMLPTVAAAVGVIPADSVAPEAARGEGVLSLPEAAAAAAASPGTEVSRADVSGGPRRPRGGWAWLRHRRHHPIPAVGGVEPSRPDDVQVAPPGPTSNISA
ncbi:MAG: SGNH/GDSL hydrolase family protein [Actinomycetota bacterium]|nr:SGNH/GDSL hydrolase family protein [Actinomycetota bacterium]